MITSDLFVQSRISIRQKKTLLAKCQVFNLFEYEAPVNFHED